MTFKYILYEHNKLFKLYPYKHQLDALTAENLRLMINSARYQIRQSKKKCDFENMYYIFSVVEQLYYKYSVKNKTSEKYFYSFVAFFDKITGKNF